MIYFLCLAMDFDGDNVKQFFSCQSVHFFEVSPSVMPIAAICRQQQQAFSSYVLFFSSFSVTIITAMSLRGGARVPLRITTKRTVVVRIPGVRLTHDADPLISPTV